MRVLLNQLQELIEMNSLNGMKDVMICNNSSRCACTFSGLEINSLQARLTYRFAYIIRMTPSRVAKSLLFSAYRTRNIAIVECDAA